MKRMIKFFALSIVLISFATISYGQVDATATATATVIAPLTISASSDLDFGSLAATSGGTVSVSAAGVRTATAGVTLVPGATTAAAYLISAYNGANITIAIPAAAITLTDASLNTMTIDTYVSSIPAGNYTLTAASATLSLGATLHVAAGQPAGTYTNSSDLTVTVNYQ